MKKSVEKKQSRSISRRKFLKSAGKAAVAAPATAVVLNAALKPQIAQAQSGAPPA